MKTRMMHGATIETTTPAETHHIVGRHLAEHREKRTSIRAGQAIILDANGAGQDEIYKVPLGYRFYVRRVSLNLSTASDPLTGNVALNVAGHYIVYQRSGTFIEYGNPTSPAGIPSIPGAQTWSEQEGPYLSNGEVFEVRAFGLTAGSSLDVAIQGILVDPPSNTGRN